MRSRKSFRALEVAAVIVVFTVLIANLHQPAAGNQTAQSVANRNLPEGKIAVIDSEQFAAPKAGIQRLLVAFDVLEREFKPRRDELQQLQQRYEQLVKDIQAQKNNDPKILQAKYDEAETLKRNIERKQQDGQRSLENRGKELTNSIYQDISTSLQAYARQQGVSLLFDLSKMSGTMMIVNDKVNITDAFIADYNQRNPATANPK